MSCSHGPGLKCPICAPELWHPSPEEINKIHKRIVCETIENLLNWKRAYYYPEDPEVNSKDVVPDSRYDLYENALKKRFPKHPFLSMVGYEHAKRQECLDWEPEDGRFNP